MKYILSLVMIVCFTITSHSKSREIGENIDVTHYEIHLNEINISDRTLDANTIISFKTLSSLDELDLELKSLNVSSVTSDDVIINNFSQDGDVLNIIFGNTVPANTNISLSISYEGNTFNESWGGIHWSNDYVYNLGVGFDSQPHNLGKTWFPCIDNFTDKASYDLYITLPSDMVSSCGGLLTETNNNGNGTKTDHWVVSQEIATYLMSFAIGDFVLWEDTYEGIERNIPINVYAKSNQIDKVEATFANTKIFAAFFEDKFGPFPFNRISYVSTNLGCMEHVDNIAFASSLITGTSNIDSDFFISHEMAHAWFGNKVTCSTAADMWLNEGFATFCNNYYYTELYGEDFYYEAMDNLIDDIIMSCHTKEGWIPLNELPLDLTYGTMAYDKGAVVAHTLMNYLGRETFNDAIKYYLNKFDSKAASSEDLCEALTEATGIDMNNFFESWVYTPGSPVYYVQYFTTEPNGDKFDVTINMIQDHRGAEYIGNAVRYELTFVDEDWNMHDEIVSWDGQSADINITLDFEPAAIFCDINNKFADACHDETYILKQTGSKDFGKAKFKAIVEDISDSTLLRIEHRWIGPTSAGEIPEGLTISSDRYWTIHRLDKGEATIKGEFQYHKNTSYDANLLVNPNDSVVLLYRPDGLHQWQSINYAFQGNNTFGRMTVDNVMNGDYVLGVWDEEHAIINENNSSLNINIYPNPAKDFIKLSTNSCQMSIVSVYNHLGILVEEIEVNSNDIEINTSEYSNGIYLIDIITDQGKVTKEFIKTK